MEIGIIGLPFSGKTTLFSTLTNLDTSSTHASGKVEIHRGVVSVPDSRLNKLTEILEPKKQVNATIEYIDVGGLEKQASAGKGFDPQFLSVLKTTNALCHVVRAFENPTAPHPEGSIDPLRDIKIVESEFILSDLSIVENRIDRLEKQIGKSKSEEDIRELQLMNRFKDWLEQEQPLREMDLSDEEQQKIRGYQFLSAKPLILAINYNEEDISRDSQLFDKLKDYQEKGNMVVTGLSAQVELEISKLEESDKEIFLSEMEIDQPALDKLIRKSYDLLNQISFFTFNEDECRAWTIREGTKAQKAAGAIHSDMERGFIRAEVLNFEEFIQYGNFVKCREKGVLRLEGKDYIVKDGDIVTIRFNV